MAFCGDISLNSPMVMVGILPSNYSHRIVKETACFVANLCTAEQKEMFYYLDSHYGADEDRLAAVSATLSDGIKVNAPLVEDCPVNIECTVVNVVSAGDHDMLVANVEYVYALDYLAKDGGTIDFGALNLLFE